MKTRRTNTKQTFPVSFRIKESTEKVLQAYANVHGYSYGGKPSISQLLDAIGDKKISLVKENNNSNLDSDGYDVNFKMSIQDYAGTLSTVAKILHKHNIPVIGVETISRPKIGDIDPNEVNVKDAITFMAYCDIVTHVPITLASTISSILKEIMDLTLENLSDDAWRGVEESIGYTKTSRQDKIVEWCRCSVAVKITAESFSGLFLGITEALASERMGILSTYRKAHGESIVSYYFHLNISNIEILSKSIDKITERLEEYKAKVEYVKADELLFSGLKPLRFLEGS
jgi:(p)ppGpp synthase/HD superfamily hydrolase